MGSSHVAKSALAPRAKLALPAISREFTRHFNSSSPLKNATAAVAEEKEAPGPSDIVDKYGALTFWGMVASIVVTKEVFVIDAEFLLALEVGAFALAGYVMTGDQVDKWSKDEDDKATSQFNDANDFMLTMLNQYKTVQEVNQFEPAVLKQYLGEYKEALVENAAYQTVLPKHEARAAVIAALEQIKSREETAASAEWQATVEAAVEDAIISFDSAFIDPEYLATLPSEEADEYKVQMEEALVLQQDMLAFAIDRIGDVEGDAATIDPVKELFLATFDEDQEDDDEEDDDDDDDDDDEEEEEEEAE